MWSTVELHLTRSQWDHNKSSGCPSILVNGDIVLGLATRTPWFSERLTLQIDHEWTVLDNKNIYGSIKVCWLSSLHTLSMLVYFFSRKCLLGRILSIHENFCTRIMHYNHFIFDIIKTTGKHDSIFFLCFDNDFRNNSLGYVIVSHVLLFM